MPIYEYRCDDCGHELEAMQKLSEQPLQDCPECSQPTLKKLMSAVGFRLKGSGWYETDFKTDGKKNLADSGDGKADKKAESKSEGKLDSKSNGKSDSKAGDSGKSSGTTKPSGGSKAA